MAETKSMGEIIDNMSIDDIINHEHFNSLSVFNGVGVSPDYWEVMFESKKRSDKGHWLTFYNQEVHSKFYKCYKLKR